MRFRGAAALWLFSPRRQALILLEHCTACFARPNVRGNRRAAAGRLGPVGENVPRTANRAKVACRSASG